MTGPVPGFVAYFAECMAAYARREGVAPDVAERAVRQLFRGSGALLATTPESPAEYVEAMIRYAGTTAAGLLAMRASPIEAAVAEGLDAATQKARAIAPGA
ncbi:pyrroline-5-carboxylate reductase family protein [Acuticoccus kandeliae]|uniref:pyrroline-5-carboxylate reductase family protein n=1 Tax=Acuticoccus kandeliae TaxID=2073160 RepID=UPI001FEAAE9F|nr:pyrroline-5-carboxylate reductase dimerization domain-containing protein [Acuticoccus kandeliae]